MKANTWLSSIEWRLHIVDTVIYLSVLAPCLALLWGLIPPIQGSFHCSDPSIQFPYHGDTVSKKLLISGVILPVFFLILLTEVFHVPWNQGLRTVITTTATVTGKVFLRYWITLTANVLLNLVLKILTSTPRPHFIDTCQPDWERINCTENGGNVQFEISLCQGDVEMKEIHDAMKSFPSGHAQLSWFAAVFIIIYVSHRVGKTYSRLWGPWLQLVSILLASMSSISRITDHRHHTMDVVAGALLGALMG